MRKFKKENPKMQCPKCSSYLVKGKDREFETLSDHVCNPNREHYPLRPTWICNEIACPASMEDIFWDEYGEFYGWNRGFEFKDDIHTAYPSHARKMDIEIYKKGLKSKIYLPAALMLWFLKPMIEFNYKADDYGKVLKKTWSLKWLKKDKFFSTRSYCTYYTFPLVNIIHFLKTKYRNYKNSDINNLSKFSMNQLKRDFEPIAKWDRRWWRHTELFLAKIIFKKWYLKSLNK